jgi:RHS repeat-associated protein
MGSELGCLCCFEQIWRKEYDAWGNRASKTIGGVETDYIFDVDRNVIAEANQATWQVTYARLDDQLLAEYENGTTYFIHQDYLSSARLLTDNNGNVYDSLDYLPFGEQIAGGTATTHKFTGYERDAESGLDNAQARYYGSSLGRFMSPDPYNAGADPTNPQSWNMYSYVINNPLTFTDPSGLYVDGPGQCSIAGDPCMGGGPDLGDGDGGDFCDASSDCGLGSPVGGPYSGAAVLLQQEAAYAQWVGNIEGGWGPGFGWNYSEGAGLLTAPSGGGGPYTTPAATAARAAVNTILSSNNSCSSFLNAATAGITGGEILSAAQVFNDVDIRLNNPNDPSLVTCYIFLDRFANNP